MHVHVNICTCGRIFDRVKACMHIPIAHTHIRGCMAITLSAKKLIMIEEEMHFKDGLE
jgi:hypothetical protein